MSVVLFVAGFLLLAVASDHFVVGAARLARAVRVSTLVVGVVVIGFGTSLPELLVSGTAAARGDLEIGVGNVVGSNVANLALLLGIAALVHPLVVRSQTVRREAPATVLAVVLFTGLVQGGLTRIEGLLLLVALGASMVSVLVGGRVPDVLEPEVEERIGRRRRDVAREGMRTLGGLAGTLAGAELLLRGAQDLAASAGLDEGFVGLTLVAVGTSLPELVTVVQAARRQEPDLIVGNLLGSTTFNALFVGAAIALVGPGALDSRSLTVVGPAFMTVVTLVVWIVMRTDFEVSRREGLALLAVYVGFVVGVA